MSNTPDERRSASDQARDRAALVEVVPGVAVLVVLQGSLILLNPEAATTPWTVLWSLLPVAPALWLVWSQIRGLRRADEYQRVVQLEAMAVGFGVVILLSLVGGLLDAAGIGSARQSLQLTFIGGVLTWIAALAAGTRRAR
jgi:hypothetical protein